MTDPCDDVAALDALRCAVGRTETRRDTFTAAPLAGLSAALDRAGDPTPLPALAHRLFFLPHAPARDAALTLRARAELASTRSRRP